MKNKKLWFSTFFLIIAVIAFKLMTKGQSLKITKLKKPIEDKKKIEKKVSTNNLVKPKKQFIQQKKIFVNAPVVPALNEWEQKAIKNLDYTTLGKAEIRIEKIGRSTINLNGLKKKVNKAKFFLKHKETGKISNFFAMVDPNTGRIYQTWGATRYENFIPDEDLKLKVETY